MAKPQARLTLAALKRMQERIADGAEYSPEEMAFIEKELRLALRRQKFRRKKAVHKKLLEAVRFTGPDACF